MKNWYDRIGRNFGRLAGAMTVLLSVLLFSFQISAQELGERVQMAVNDGVPDSQGRLFTATAEFAQDPKPGNLIVAISTHRVSWNEAYIDGGNWNQALEMVFDGSDSATRRGMAVWYKTAREGEPRQVSTRWEENGELTDPYRRNGLVIMEFEGSWIYDVATAMDMGPDDSTGVYTGFTAMPRETPSLVVSIAHARETAGEAAWTNGLEENYRFVAGTASSYNLPFTIQTAYRMSDELQEWDAEASWSNTAGAAIGAIAVFRPFLETEWLFTCDSELITDASVTTNAMMLMLDTSKSMEWLSLWEPAKRSIAAAVTELEDSLSFGIGFFGGSNATIEVEADDPNFRTRIIDEMNSRSPSGATPTHRAVEAVAGSRTVTEMGGVGVIITDGEPKSCGSDSCTLRDETINATCKARSEGVRNYIVGLGGSTNTAFNNLQAAAAGTGCCGPSANADCSNGIGLDPCDGDQMADWLDTRDGNFPTCYGSLSAADEDSFTEQLLALGRDVQCTFPLDTSGWPNGLIDDFRAVQVTGLGSITEAIYHRDSVNADPPGEGWVFADAARTAIRLTEHWCNQIDDSGAGIEQVRTKVACSCEQRIAEQPYCLIPAVVATACPAGLKTCNPDQTWYCAGPAEPMHSDCPFFDCPEDPEPTLCHVDNEFIYYHGPPGQGGRRFEEEGDADASTEINRCKVGAFRCTEEEGAWCQPARPMPEVCNGLDNDCDGAINNMSTSWSKNLFGASFYTLDGSDYPGAACNEEDVCLCSDGPGEHGGLTAIMNGASAQSEFEEYIADYGTQLTESGSCECTPLISQ